jgi:hypothetical protein
MRGHGIFGSGLGEGNRAISFYFPGFVYKRNVTIGAPSSLYPADKNYFPQSIEEVGFVDAANGDYRLQVTSPYKGAAKNGKDIGADVDLIHASINGA